MVTSIITMGIWWYRPTNPGGFRRNIDHTDHVIDFAAGCTVVTMWASRAASIARMASSTRSRTIVLHSPNIVPIASSSATVPDNISIMFFTSMCLVHIREPRWT